MAEGKVQNTLPLGSLLHWYEVRDILGRGGYGITYLAFDQNLHRNVAIKEYLPCDFAQRVNDNTVHPLTNGHSDLFNWGLDRFLIEARTLAQFNHEAIIRVNSVFEHNNTAYMVMEYEEGEDLASAYNKHSPLSQDDLLKLFLPITEGLALVHDAGFIHRDIKPANIYIRKDGSPVLLDFGSARQTLRSQTTALTTLVTTGYAPFEQYNESDSEQGVWTDIYALGSTLYFCITGEKPVDALKRSASLLKHGRDSYTPISNTQVPGFTPKFLRAIDHALMFHPERRPHNVRYWADMLTGKVDVAPITDDLFTIHRPGDTSYDLDATVVMNPVKRSSIKKQQEAVDEKTVVPNNSASQNRSLQTNAPPPTSNPQIQSVSSEQLDKITEALSRRAEKSANPAPKQPGVSKKFTIEKFLLRLDEFKAIVIKWLQELLNRLPSVSTKQFANLLQSQLHNKAILYGAAGVALLLAITIFIVILSGKNEPEQSVATNHTPVSEQGRLPETTATTNPAADTASSSENQTEIAAISADNGDVKIKAEANTSQVNPDIEKYRSIAALLNNARTETENGRYIENDKQGAYYHYIKILDLEPGHEGAIEGISNIKNVYAQLVSSNIAEKDWRQAENSFSKFKIVSNDKIQISEFQKLFDDRKKQLKTINSLLKQGDALFKKDKLTKPDSKNALAIYAKVLSIDPDEQRAKEGINKIVDKLGEYMQNQLTIRRVKYADKTYKKIAGIDPNAAILSEVKPELNKLLAQRKKVLRMLRQAKTDFINGKIIKPKGNNALARYRSVIEIDPGNRTAKRGIKSIYEYYVADFNRYLEQGDFDKADRILGTLSNVKFRKKDIAKLEKQLGQKRAN